MGAVLDFPGAPGTLEAGSPQTCGARKERGDHHPAAPQPFHERLCSPTEAGYPGPTEDPRRYGIVTSRRDSDLEAFSHNPTDGSFAPLAPQPSTYTKCLNLRFLSY
ncbi:tripartite motif-containing protein 65-like protein [Lates japonicus]|uniref:Tripartite motif-containing protein 65-like protein n=1 Tax=Lates japonicus TaxID=270547 RepID=A0AAD3NIR1_LATJO|nr:tripartite motif-containing protein 65-like protein [Lates japonicus]GLD72622.1 tripartite motif-containing protein 65-like protein [Lates japonicus]